MAAKPKYQVRAEEAVECAFCQKSRSVPSVLSPNTDRKQHARKKSEAIASSGSCDDHEPPVIPLKMVKPFTDKEIGRGAYGRIFEVEYSKIQCAAKEVHEIMLNVEDKQALLSIKRIFLKECHIWSHLQHPCIVQFIGVYYPAKSKFRIPVIIMEKMQFSLTKLVEIHSKTCISLNNTVTILKDVCLGLEYLHTRTPQIVHRDLTPNNILLCQHFRAKITDLGMARTLEATNTKTLTKAPGTPDFMPLECLIDKPVYGLPLDIFSFGGVILHVTTRQWPTPAPWVRVDPNTGEKLTLTSELQRRQLYLDKMTKTYEKFKPLVKSCLNDNPNDRPTVVEVLIEIKSIQKACPSLYYDIWANTEKQPAAQSHEQQQQLSSSKQNQQHGKEQQQQRKQEQQHQQEDKKQLKEAPKKKKPVLKKLFSRKTKNQITESEDMSSDSELSDTSSLSLSQEDIFFDNDTKPPPSASIQASNPDPDYPLFIAKYDFSSDADEDLNFKKGDLLYIVNADEGDWWYAKAKRTSQGGYIPQNYVTKLRQPKPDPKISNCPLYVAKYDYSSEGDKCLSFKKGDLFYVFNAVEGDWWFARAKDSNQEGYIPNNYVAQADTLEAEDWFFGAIPRKHAENLLMQPFNDTGSFLIRNSESTPGDYSLSVKFANEIKHYRIKHNSKGYCISNWVATFGSISMLVAHYSKKSDGLCISLGNTCLITMPQTISSTEEDNEIWEVDRSSIQFVKKLSNGQFGEIWQGVWNGTTEVAVKVLTLGIISGREFFEGVALMKQLRHPKLVQIHAICTQEEPIYIVTELMEQGSLLQYLKGNGRSLKLPQLLDIGAQVAAGMAYLEEKNYVHRDLGARNILVSENLTCKVKGFSMVRVLSESIYEAHTGSKFPIRWTAPEALLYNSFTVKSDVWSFGIFLYEVVTYGHFPYAGMRNTQVIDALQAGYRLPCPVGCPEQLHNIMKDCWKDDASSRPTFESLHWRTEDFYVESEPTHLCPQHLQ